LFVLFFFINSGYFYLAFSAPDMLGEMCADGFG
jgi:hypothetical protein